MELIYNLVRRIAELKKTRKEKGDTRDSYVVAANQLHENKDLSCEKAVHIIVPSIIGRNTLVVRYMAGTSADIVRKVSELYDLPDFDDNNSNGCDYGIYKIESISNYDAAYSSEYIYSILEYVFDNILREEYKSHGNIVHRHNIKNVVCGLNRKFKLPKGNKIFKKYDR